MLGSTPERLSAIVPETVPLTIFPLGGQSTDGFAETVITGGVLSIFTVTDFYRFNVADVVDAE